MTYHDVSDGPMPDPERPMFELLLDTATAVRGTDGIAQAVAWMTVHAWMEGHLEGEDHCPGCEDGFGRARGPERDEIGPPGPHGLPPADQMPTPPYPHPSSRILGELIRHNLSLIERMPDRQVLTEAGRLAWAEGHIEGEDRCKGCDYRPATGPRGDRDAFAASKLGLSSEPWGQVRGPEQARNWQELAGSGVLHRLGAWMSPGGIEVGRLTGGRADLEPYEAAAALLVPHLLNVWSEAPELLEPLIRRSFPQLLDERDPPIWLAEDADDELAIVARVAGSAFAALGTQLDPALMVARMAQLEQQVGAERLYGHGFDRAARRQAAAALPGDHAYILDKIVGTSAALVQRLAWLSGCAAAGRLRMEGAAAPPADPEELARAAWKAGGAQPVLARWPELHAALPVMAIADDLMPVDPLALPRMEPMRAARLAEEARSHSGEGPGRDLLVIETGHPAVGELTLTRARTNEDDSTSVAGAALLAGGLFVFEITKGEEGEVQIDVPQLILAAEDAGWVSSLLSGLMSVAVAAWRDTAVEGLRERAFSEPAPGRLALREDAEGALASLVAPSRGWPA